jgi:hypothetical protein
MLCITLICDGFLDVQSIKCSVLTIVITDYQAFVYLSVQQSDSQKRVEGSSHKGTMTLFIMP